MTFGKDKMLGTFVPLFSLWSSQQLPKDHGTFASGELFLDWLHETKQQLWQLLPLNETQLEKGSQSKHVPSPYKGYGIGLDPAFLQTEYSNNDISQIDKVKFLDEHSYWVEDYALFSALRDHFGTDDWRVWDPEIRLRSENALSDWNKKLHSQISQYIDQQCKLHLAYKQFHAKAHSQDIQLVGDLPFYISVQSPLVWKFQYLFLIEEDGTMPFVSGCVSRSQAHFGRQVWGHPLYKWELLNDVIALWKVRLNHSAFLYDILRFDYGAGFFEYAAKDPMTASNDLVKKGPGEQFLTSISAYAKQKGLAIFIEDSGKHVFALRKYMNENTIAGIRIFRFAYNEIQNNVHPYYAAIQTYPPLSVAYTTTHDTEPLIRYLRLLNQNQIQQLAEAVHYKYSGNLQTFASQIRSAIINSPAKTVIIPIQDWLLTEERINIPGTEKERDDPNWQYRVERPIERFPKKR